jgi:hypothetical protein
MDDDGCFFFVDRKDMIKRAGERIRLGGGGPEAAPAVFDAAVVAMPDPVRDHAIKAYVILREVPPPPPVGSSDGAGATILLQDLRPSGFRDVFPGPPWARSRSISSRKGRPWPQAPLLYTRVMGSHSYGWFWTALDKIKADDTATTSGRPSTTRPSSPSATRSAQAST